MSSSSKGFEYDEALLQQLLLGSVEEVVVNHLTDRLMEEVGGTYSIAPKSCAHQNCKRTWIPYHSEDGKSSRGWVIHDKNGKDWCPDHVSNSKK